MESITLHNDYLISLELQKQRHREIFQVLKEAYPDSSEPVLRIKASLMLMQESREELEKAFSL
jgi:hypothetical protein